MSDTSSTDYISTSVFEPSCKGMHNKGLWQVAEKYLLLICPV